jgi:hypothetical protein
MNKTIAYSIFFLFIFINNYKSIGQQKTKEKDYSFELKEVFNGKIAFGGHKALFGETKSESETLYKMTIKIKINGFEKNKPIDFNYFSIVDHQNETRHPLSWVNFRGYYVKKEKIESNILLKDTFLEFEIPNIENYTKNELEANAISMITKKSKSYKYLFRKTIPNKSLIRKKVLSFYFYTKTIKIGTFSFYYKDRLIKTFTTTKKGFLKFK